MKTTIGIIAPSSQAPKIELALGVDLLKKEGFRIATHPQCKKSHLFFAGKDSERAEAFFEFARDPEVSVLWFARGGYGALRILPLLDKLVSQHGVPPRKLLVGCSDATALLEYVRTRWGWHVLHAPMPATRTFSGLKQEERDTLLSWVKKESAKDAWDGKRFKFYCKPSSGSVEGEVVGGNIAVLASMVGTPYAPQLRDRILFLEDVDEALYRLDRMLQQLHISGCLNGVQAIVLGNFLNCRDAVSNFLKAKPTSKSLKKLIHSPAPKDLKPLRKVMKAEDGLKKIFTELGEALKVPIAYGLPVGHGPDHAPLALGAHYCLEPDGRFRLVHWDWLNS